MGSQSRAELATSPSPPDLCERTAGLPTGTAGEAPRGLGVTASLRPGFGPTPLSQAAGLRAPGFPPFVSKVAVRAQNLLRRTAAAS